MSRAGSRSTGCLIDSELAESGRQSLAIRGRELPGQLRPDRAIAECDFSRLVVIVDQVFCQNSRTRVARFRIRLADTCCMLG